MTTVPPPCGVSDQFERSDLLGQAVPRDGLEARFLPPEGAPPVRWRILEGLSAYEQTVRDMEQLAMAIRQGDEQEAVWLVEHPPLYTAGASARDSDLVAPDRFPVHATGRGGEYTYHGPGQRVCYVMLDLKRRKQDVRAFVAALEAWIITTLADFSVTGERREDRVGVWVRRPDKAPLPGGIPHEDKIAAIGIRLKKWVSFHGISINVEPDLTHFDGIVPCGVTGHGVTSLADLDLPVAMEDVDVALKRNFEAVFGPVD